MEEVISAPPPFVFFFLFWMTAPRDVVGEEAGVGDLFVFQMKRPAGPQALAAGSVKPVRHALVAPMENQSRMAEARFAGGFSWGSGMGTEWGPGGSWLSPGGPDQRVSSCGFSGQLFWNESMVGI